MFLKSKLLVSLTSVCVAGGTGVGVYYGVNKSKDKKELEIEKKAKTETEEEQQKILAKNKEVAKNLLTDCEERMTKNADDWNNLYDPNNLLEEITFECKSKKVVMKVSKNQDSDYRKITDTTDKWWPSKTQNFIVFKISEKISS